ncbi:helix-turn-helix domain-containing protein [Polaribacter aestuariivivens]|uniref:helix-turn-helix domain-containing protein n=1 Tax=Polaribacter aestuariivivens TaxID=2304626 RepID=UPI003F4906D3
MDFAETSTSVIFEKPYFKTFLEDFETRVTKIAVKQTKLELSKEIELNTSQIAKILNVSEPTVLKYMNEGYRKIGRLKHTKHDRKYTASKYDVLQFKEKLKH